MEKSKDLKKLNRTELIEIIYQLKKSEQELQVQVDSLQKRLNSRNLKIANVGTLADAALSLSDIFASAQNAADMYLEEIRKKHEAADDECTKLISKAQKEAEEIVQNAERQRDFIQRQCNTARAELHKVHSVIQELNNNLSFE